MSVGHKLPARSLQTGQAFLGFASLLIASACGGGGSPPPPQPVLQSIAVSPGSLVIELGNNSHYSATGNYTDGSTKDVTSTVQWSSINPQVATVDNAGNATTQNAGQTTIQATLNSVTGKSDLTVLVPAHRRFNNAGMTVQFDRRGWPAEYWTGQILQEWSQFDSVVGNAVSDEVSLQLDKMRAMGVNTITIELRAADPTATDTFQPPDCNINPVLGVQFPQPTPTELANLRNFFDLVDSKGIKVWLGLTNTHMEQQPPTNSQTWLGSILGAIGNHHALDLVLLNGAPHLNGDGTCGIPAEPPLWLGPGSIPATYVQWAMNFAMSQGVPATKLSAEVIVGSYFLENSPPAGSDATNGHLWSPITVAKGIFDNLGIPQNQRTYALSFYEHRKCFDAQSLPCTDLDPHDWADQTLQYNTGVIGAGARVVVAEFGDLTPVDQVNWNTPHAVESAVFLFQKYAVDGATFWRWISFSNDEDADVTLATPVKRRGVNFDYNPVQKEIVDMAGTHVSAVPNGSFENASGGIPTAWTVSGSGMASQYLLTQEPAEPQVPSRGTNAMRMVTGNASNDIVLATSTMIPVVPFALLTTTSNLRFSWTGDPNPTAPSSSRPQVFVNISYFQSDGKPSAVHTQDTFSYFQEDSTTGFATFPTQYVTPSDSAFVEIQFGAARNGLPTAITLDVDNVR